MFRTILFPALRESRSGITDFHYVSQRVLVSNQNCTIQLLVQKNEEDILLNTIGFLYVGQSFFHTKKWSKMGRLSFKEVLSLRAVKNSRHDSYKIRILCDIRRYLGWAFGG